MTKGAQAHKPAFRYFWGRMAAADTTTRIASLVFVLSTIASMSFCQLGFWPVGIIDGKPVYLMLIVGPLIMCSLMYGPLMALLLGLYTGTIVFVHAQAFPLDYYEVYFMTPLNTFVLLTVFCVVSNLLFSLVLRRGLQGVKRTCLIIAICIVMSLCTSALVVANTILAYGGLENLSAITAALINSPLGLLVQALIDAALMMAMCLVADRIVHSFANREAERALLSIFRNWMLLVSSIVFMLTSGVIFSFATVEAQNEAEENMLSEVGYLKVQIEALEDGDDCGILLEGYSVPIDGYVVLTDEEATIVATDDDVRYPLGGSLVELLGYDSAYFEGLSASERAAAFLGMDAQEEGAMAIQTLDEDGVLTMDFTFLAAEHYEGGYVVMFRTSNMVYRSRLDTMVASTLLAVLLIVSIALLATVLLNRVVVRRIGEANESLGKITQGDLSERVSVRDTREFKSLSTGINTTVSALKDTIDEVEQRNAQDLATAKAIQESALPREFPPFPDIDHFDIYASMKTAKEVGGDFYDFFLIEEEGGATGKLGFVMADVSGKGIPAALFMMTAKTQIRNYMEAGLPVNEAVDAANHQLCIGNDAGMFVTAWVGVLDYESGELSFVNGGHNPPLIQHEGSWEWVKDVSGMPLGLFDGIPYDAYTRQLQPGDMLYTYTDGVTEAMDAQGNLFGEDRLEKTLYEYGKMNSRSVGVGVRRAITDFTKDAEQSDDITMLILKYGVPPEKRAVMILPAVDTQLVHVNNFVHEELRRRGAPKSVYNPLDIAAEELFVNVCHYAYPDATPDNPGEVRIGFEYEANPPSLTVTISDDGIPYNPLAKPDAVTPDDIAEVPIGGLGILMAKQSVDDMTYERAGESNILTFVKSW